ncbi:MAG: hypothetical protein O4808_04495, partial [Trichodesmium sp. St17_bin3_1_1]|nr:hypothetical protein [Trichodesmium sp. St17_bin3_1_1]
RERRRWRRRRKRKRRRRRYRKVSVKYDMSHIVLLHHLLSSMCEIFYFFVGGPIEKTGKNRMSQFLS